MENYSVQRLSADNLRDLVYLYRHANQQEVSLHFLARKYNTQSLGTEYIGFIAYAEKDKPIAYYGIIPCRMQLEGKVILVAQGADTMTHPDYRNKGLFYEMAKKTFQLAKENNIQFIFGFANQHSLPGAIKLGFRIMPDYLQLFKTLSTFPAFGALMNRFSVSRILYRTYVRVVLAFMDRPASQVLYSGSHNGIIRDQVFMNYKKYNKSFIVKVSDSFVWLRVDGSLKIGLVKIGEGGPQVFMMKIKRLAALLGCGEIIFFTHKGSRLYEFLSPVIAPVDGLPICFQNLTGMPFAFETIGFEYADLDIF